MSLRWFLALAGIVPGLAGRGKGKGSGQPRLGKSLNSKRLNRRVRPTVERQFGHHRADGGAELEAVAGEAEGESAG